MSRSNDVATAMTIAAHPPPDFKYDVRWAVLNTLAAEIERLETDAKAMTIMLRGRGELVKRAEAAEARVKELGAQNAKLREALEGLVSWGSMGEGDVDPRTTHRYLADFATAEVALDETKGTP